MSQGYTICPKCHREVSCRGLDNHLKRGCKDFVPEKKEKVDNSPTKGMLRQAAERAFPTNKEDIFLPSGREIRGEAGRTETFHNPYRIADKFIKNSIQEGVLILNIKQLLDEGRAEMKLKKDHIEIKIYLAKFRKAFGNG